jgi:uncharacterized protein
MSLSLEQLSQDIVSAISSELDISKIQVENTLKLILSDCTVPFVARYRKEATGGLDEVQIRDIRDRFEYIVALNERRDAILKSIEEQGKLNPELRARIVNCKNKSEIEDLYLPYKPKKRTRGQIAKERGLEPLALEIFSQNEAIPSLRQCAAVLVSTHADLVSEDVVLSGVRDIISEMISETAEIRGQIRTWTFENAFFRSVVKDEFKDKRTKFNDYYDFKESVKDIPPHRLMALRRGEKEEMLKVSLEFDETEPIANIEGAVIKSTSSSEVREFLREACKDAYIRLISPSIETELRLESKSRAEEEAIFIFSKNLRNLLLLPPIPKKVVLGVDPGFRTGSKLVVVDSTGKLLEFLTIYPDHDAPEQNPKNESAREKFLGLVRKHSVDYISIGNGTAGREMEAFVEKALEAEKARSIRVVMVNESGASVYSASDEAREEFPDLDISYRGAVSIARRLQDPLAELVKIDPKSIGVGQYQHDVNQGKLKRSLEEVVESCVNFVGVNLNTASASLLSYVSGIGPSLARGIVAFRNSNGEFSSRKSLMGVPGFGNKTFEQAAGFLRIVGGENPLDNSAVHPEAYVLVEKMSESLSIALAELVGNISNVQRLNLGAFVQGEVGLPTLQDIAKELSKPGRDPRADGVKMSYTKSVRSFEHLQEGQVLTGTVTNVTNFGAFVDIGVHQDGLIHVSELSHEFIKNAAEHISVGDQVKVKVIGVDKERKRISLSKKATEEGGTKSRGVAAPASSSTAASYQTQRPARANAAPRQERTHGNARPSFSREARREVPSVTEKSAVTVEDLLNKFKSSRL